MSAIPSVGSNECPKVLLQGNKGITNVLDLITKGNSTYFCDNYLQFGQHHS